MNRRLFSKQITAASASLGMLASLGCESKVVQRMENENHTSDSVHADLSSKMYEKALEITKSKIRGGDTELFFKQPFIDAAFSSNIFLWDTCFMCCFAKYHLDELPVYQALDNFYGRMESDGYICREYRPDGTPLWPKTHPVSINPPLLAFAEWEIYQVSKNIQRIKEVYPKLKNNFEFHVHTYMMEDALFYGDTLGMGMDNIPRAPRQWEPTEGNGMTHQQLGEQLAAMNASAASKLDYFIEQYMQTRQGVWNKQGRLVDFSAQMAMYAKQLEYFANVIGAQDDLPYYKDIHSRIKEALNTKCWNEEDGFYYDLGFDEQIPRMHIGMYWTLLGEIVPEERMDVFLSHLYNPSEFYRLTPLPALSASDPDYVGWGDYWLGGVWAPTVYMVLRGLSTVGKQELANDLARKVYKNVSIVFEATGTFWENYAPDLISYGMPAKKDFCGWTALIPIAVYHEYIKT